MPFATIKNICSFSSEDPSHPASSILESESNKKWKTLKNGEKSANIILQLDKPEVITGIDIGNEHSAFVEILVGRTGCNPVDFKELILSSSFMTPFESKNSTSINRVRCFGNEKLLPTAKEKWDLIKIICTQPFNKHIQYGLSFIKIHVAKAKESKTKPINQNVLTSDVSLATDSSKTQTVLPEKKLIGKFKLRDDEDSDSENSTSLFRRWKESKNPENEKKFSTAAKIRDLSSGSASKDQSELLKPKNLFQKNKGSTYERNIKQDDAIIFDRNRNELFYNKDDEKPNDKYESKILLDQERVNKERESQRLKKTAQKLKNESSDPSERALERAKKISDDIIKEVKSSAKKRLSSFKASPSCKKRRTNHQIIYKPFNKLLEDVTLVISGIQNPDRTDLRRKAIAMGAKYKADWENGCTHLICAFKNTPKYNQVQKLNGKIVKRTWIEDSYDSKKRLSWRRFALDSDEENKSDSEDEWLDISMKPNKPSVTSIATSVRENSKYMTAPLDDTLAQYDLTYCADSANPKNTIVSCGSGSDTEDELEKLRILQKPNEPTIVSNIRDEKLETEDEEKADENLSTTMIKDIPLRNLDVYEISTDEEEYTKSQKKIKELNKGNLNYDFFAGKKFYIHPKTNAVDKMKLKQFIEDYKGELTGIMSESNYAISGENINPDSKFSGEVVTPLWIYECNDMECLIPTKRYLPS